MFSVIIKIFGKKIPHHILKLKLQQLWCHIEHLTIIDLRWDYFKVKFLEEPNMETTLHGGPWFVMGHFFSVRNWVPNFISANSKIQVTTIWIRLPNYIPTKF